MTNQLASKDAVHGLSCPRCGGMVPTPEGQIIVTCPYCDQRSVVAVNRSANVPAGSGSFAPAPKVGSVTEITGPRMVSVSAPQTGVDKEALKAKLEAEILSARQPGAVDQASTPKTGAAIASSMMQFFTDAANATSQASTAPVEVDPMAPAAALGIRRYQAPLKVSREQAEQAMKSFLGGRVQIARDCSRKAELQETFLVHLPFWTVWARGVAYAFGQVKTGSGDHERWEPREKKFAREMVWNIPACEVGEFGVRQVSLEGCPLDPFNPDALHRTGMVFEPVGAESAALESARSSFNETIRDEVNMGRTAQVFTRLTRTRLGLVYYPLWVLRYLYRGRAFQVVVDGVTGQVLYGKAPGSVGYRAGVLVGGMAAGAITAIDIPALILNSSSKNSDNSGLGALVIFVVGLAIMFAAYRTFRYGEHYEYHRYGKSKSTGLLPVLNLPGNVRSVASAINTLEKFSS